MFPFCTPLFVPTVNVSLILLFVVYSVYTFSIMLSGREKGGGRESVCVCVCVCVCEREGWRKIAMKGSK